MREELWWKLHQSSVLRALYNQPFLAPAMKKASLMLLPSRTERVLEVKNGLGKGLLFEVNPRWEFDLWQGTYEPGVQSIAEDYFRAGKTYYDVGGGIGFYSLVAARFGAQVFTFEPDPENFASIQRHAKRNNLDGKFMVMQLAAYSHTGSLRMQRSARDDGHGQSKATFDGPAVGFEARCTTLDDFAHNHPIPDLIKIDVEGAETEVVKGCHWLLGEVRPPLLCEVHDPDNSASVKGLLTSHGYRWEWLDDPRSPPSRLFATPASNIL
ncbi:MAG: FkbM family methyltransferase [Candidatus Acidiferrales bacterium]